MKETQNRIKKITFYVNASELYSNPDDLESESLEDIIRALKEFSILDWDVRSVSTHKTVPKFFTF